MTQAMNLANFSNYLDTSGQVAPTVLNASVPVSKGGTGGTTSTGSGSVVLATSPTLTTPALGTPASGVMTNVTGLPLTTGVTGTLPVANGGTGVTTSTGSGNNVLSTSPTLTTPTITSPTISGTPVINASLITSGTAVATTSGTSVTFSSIPSWAKRITVMLNGVSTNGTSNFQLQIGAGSAETTGYVSRAQTTGSSSLSTTGYILTVSLSTAADTITGTCVLNLIGSNTWIQYGLINHIGQNVLPYSTGIKTISGTLNQIRITTVNGTDTFDAGSINVLYE